MARGKSEARLGKGLGALLGEYLGEDEALETPTRRLPLRRIRPNPFQPRRQFEEGSLGELVESIRQNGLLQPLVVRPAGSEFELVAGERRWRALQELQEEHAPAIIRELGDEQMLVLALVENLQRENLSPLEEARGYQQLVDGFGLTQETVAGRVGRSRSGVANAIRLLALPPEVQALIESGELTAGHGRAILSLEGEERQVALAREIVSEGLTVRAAERRARKARGGAQEKKRRRGGGSSGEDGGPFARRAARVLERALGTGVRIEMSSADSGAIHVSFHDSGDFERLVRRIAGDDASELFDGTG